tara:strand:- start:89 stop:289 length:201 start_codon:yes stop_codon:yes gene_type:complete
LTSLVVDYPIFPDLFLKARLIDIIYWIASQPLQHILPKKLKSSSQSKIGFCGDWFDIDNSSGGLEA